MMCSLEVDHADVLWRHQAVMGHDVFRIADGRLVPESQTKSVCKPSK